MAPSRPPLNLPFPLLLALRYLKSTRRDAFASFLSLVAAGGIGLGVMALILALAMLSGFQRALKGQVLARTPEIEITLPAGRDEDPEAAREALFRAGGVRSVQRVLRGRGWVVAGGRVEAVTLVGYEGPVPETFPGASGAPPGLYLSSGLGERWGLAPGDLLEVVSPRPTLTPFGPQPRLRGLPLAGFFLSSSADDGERVALPLEVARTLLASSSGHARERLEVRVEGSYEAAPAMAPRLAAVLPPGSKVATWRELNRPLLFALALEKAVTFLAVALVVVVAVLALVADLALIIAARRGEIGILGAMGASAGSLRRAFLLLGLLLATLGAGVGGSLGVGLALVLDRFELFAVPGQVYFIDHVPFRVEAWDLAAVLVLTVVLVLASSLHAARRATQLSPVEAMRR